MTPAEFEAAVERVLDVLAPRSAAPEEGRPWTMASKLNLIGGRETARCPIFEWGHETTPTDEEMRELAEKIVKAVAHDT